MAARLSHCQFLSQANMAISCSQLSAQTENASSFFFKNRILSLRSHTVKPQPACLFRNSQQVWVTALNSSDKLTASAFCGLSALTEEVSDPL